MSRRCRTGEGFCSRSGVDGVRPHPWQQSSSTRTTWTTSGPPRGASMRRTLTTWLLVSQHISVLHDAQLAGECLNVYVLLADGLSNTLPSFDAVESRRYWWRRCAGTGQRNRAESLATGQVCRARAIMATSDERQPALLLVAIDAGVAAQISVLTAHCLPTFDTAHRDWALPAVSAPDRSSEKVRHSHRDCSG